VKVTSMARIERLLRAIAALVALYLLAKAVYTITVPAADPRNRSLEIVVVHVAFYGVLSFRNGRAIWSWRARSLLRSR